MWLFLEKIQMFACSNNVCACRKLSTFRYHVLFCCWFLIFDINCGVCWKDKFLFKTVLTYSSEFHPVQQSWNIPLFGSWDSVKCLFAWFYVSWPDFEFCSCFYIKHFVWSKAPWNKKGWNQTSASAELDEWFEWWDVAVLHRLPDLLHVDDTVQSCSVKTCRKAPEKNLELKWVCKITVYGWEVKMYVLTKITGYICFGIDYLTCFFFLILQPNARSFNYFHKNVELLGS